MNEGTAILQTKRLVLRPFTIADAQALYTSCTSDPRVTKYLSWPAHESADETRKILAENIARYSESNFYYWAITLAATGEIMGCIYAKPSLHNAELLEPAYWLGFKYWSGGYMSEALSAVCGHILSATQNKKIICCHDKENPASGRVMEKVGFVYSFDGEYTRRDGTKRKCSCYYLNCEKL